MSDYTNVPPTERERALIVAALGGFVTDEFEPLTTEETNALCERINLGEWLQEKERDDRRDARGGTDERYLGEKQW